MTWSIMVNGERMGIYEWSKLSWGVGQGPPPIACSCGCGQNLSWNPDHCAPNNAADLKRALESDGYIVTSDPIRMLVNIKVCGNAIDRIMEALEKKPDLVLPLYHRLRNYIDLKGMDR